MSYVASEESERERETKPITKAKRDEMKQNETSWVKSLNCSNIPDGIPYFHSCLLT